MTKNCRYVELIRLHILVYCMELRWISLGTDMQRLCRKVELSSPFLWCSRCTANNDSLSAAFAKRPPSNKYATALENFTSSPSKPFTPWSALFLSKGHINLAFPSVRAALWYRYTTLVRSKHDRCLIVRCKNKINALTWDCCRLVPKDADLQRVNPNQLSLFERGLVAANVSRIVLSASGLLILPVSVRARAPNVMQDQ